MLLIGIVVGLVGGLLAGGKATALINVRLRFAALLFGALVLRYGTQMLIGDGVAIFDALRLPLYSTAFLLLVAALWANRARPGLLVVMVGVASNGLAIVLNGGWMPVYLPAVAAAGLGPGDLSPTYHSALPTTFGLDFLLRGGPIGDVIPFPLPILTNVVSLGDVFISAGLGWFVLATLLRGDPDPQPGGISLWRGSGTGAAAIAAGGIGTRAVILGGGMGPGLTVPLAAAEAISAREAAVHRPSAAVLTGLAIRVRGHPYLHLVHDARFSAFWIGQIISFFGDRLNQFALGLLVLTRTESALLTGLIYLAATLPNLLFGPIAGTFVDRWDQKRVMIVSDLVRAGLVLLIPLAAEVDIGLLYPLAFAITTVSIFFRPAKAAVVPRLVADEDLLAANSALWTSETIADIAGFPLAALLLAIVGGSFALAFWLDAATYAISAVLIAGIVVPPAIRAVSPRVGGALRSFIAELRDGWRVLRGQPALFQNTLISTLAQLSVGATIALTLVYARDAFASNEGDLHYRDTFATIQAFFGVGNLIGGLVVGAVGAHLRKGRLVVVGFVVMGLATVVLGLTANETVAFAAALVIGVFNLVYIIPTQTLFAQLTPAAFMGRVVAIRSSLVFGAMTGAMAVSASLADSIPAGTIIAVTGAITVAAGVVGALLPAVRDA